MRVLYDYQAFYNAEHGGIPRYIIELISHFQKMENVTPILPKFWNLNVDYNNLYNYDRNITWRIRDIACKYSKKITNKNISILLSDGKLKSTKLIKKGDYDIFHPTRFDNYYLEFIRNKPYVLTVHDLTVELFSEYLSPNHCRKIIHDTKDILRNVTRCIAITENTKRDLIKYYGVDPSIIDVVYHGSPFEGYIIPHHFEYESETIINKKYMLYVGSRSSYKNFIFFIKSAADILKRENIYMICVGGGSFSEKENLLFRDLEISNYITHIQAKTDQDLISLYQNAIAFIYPSVNEGFGLPTLEAFSCGCPVICSNTSSFPEVAGDAAVYFNPIDAESIREAVSRVVFDSKLRDNLRELGYIQLEKFSWKRCAEETKMVYEKALES